MSQSGSDEGDIGAPRLSTTLKTWSGIALAVSVLLLTMAAPAWAAGPGKKPSEAPTIAPGVRYTAELSNYESIDTNYHPWDFGLGINVDLWRLPPLVAHDLVTVDWQVAGGSSAGPVELVVAEDVNDYNWGAVFGESYTNNEASESGAAFMPSGSGAAETSFTVQQASQASAYLEFAAQAHTEHKTSAGGYETYPYNFALESIQHYIGINFPPPTQIAADSAITAGATLATGAPVPNGMAFTLTATWGGSEEDPDEAVQSQSYTAQANSGTMVFPLNLPSSAQGKKVSLAISRPADAEYQEARSEAAAVQVVAPPPPPPPPPAGTATVGEVAKVKHGAALLSLSCTGGPCNGGFKLRSPYKEHRVVHRHGIRRVSVHKRIAVVGRSAFSIPANQSTTLSVPLSRRGRSLLHRAKKGHLSVKLAGHGITSGAVVLEGSSRRHASRRIHWSRALTMGSR